LLKLESREATAGDGSIRSMARQAGILRAKLRISMKLIRTTEPALFILGQNSASELRCVRAPLPARSGNIEMLDCSGELPHAVACYRGNAFTGELTVPVSFFSRPFVRGRSVLPSAMWWSKPRSRFVRHFSLEKCCAADSLP
jgi:hypothetical protein